MTIQNKHFLNSPQTLVVDSLKGLCAFNPRLSLDADNKTVYLASHNRSKVALLCGGGSGHEPAHAGFVGEGMLTAAVCGNVFASPNASQVLRGIELIDNDKGTLIIVKNYTGDVLNFGLAKEKYAALQANKADKVEFVIVGDDVAVGKTQGSIVGRRGLAGTVLVYKIAGALANQGVGLKEVTSAARWVAANIATIGVGLEHCHVPGTAAGESHLQASEIEIGMGIHNEAGHRRLSPVPPLKELVPQLLELLTSTTDPERSFLLFQGKNGSDEAALMVNNLGGLSELELGGITGEVHSALVTSGIKVHRVLSGSFMTSLNMPGFSITLLLLPKPGASSPLSTEEIISLLDEPCKAPGWKWSACAAPPTEAKEAPKATSGQADTKGDVKTLAVADTAAFGEGIKRACETVISAEPEITKMDTIAGDGDCGLTLKAGAEGVLVKLSDGKISGNDVVDSIITIAQVAEVAMGGTSGALYSIFFSALAQGLRDATSSGSTSAIDLNVWRAAVQSALDKLYTYTRARPPSRTLVDPLAAFVDAFAKKGEDLRTAVKTAAAAADETKNFEAKAGRSAYVEGDRLKEQEVPDPGAWGVKVILESLVST